LVVSAPLTPRIDKKTRRGKGLSHCYCGRFLVKYEWFSEDGKSDDFPKTVRFK
jgi:hypothetical protein